MKYVGPIAFGVLLWGNMSSAQELYPTTCAETDPKRCSTPLQAGQVAPYSGQLLTTKLAIVLGQKAEHCAALVELEVSREKELSAVQKDLDAQLLRVEKTTAQEKIEALQKALKAMEDFEEPPPWYEAPPTVATLTVLVTIGVFVLAVKTVELLDR